MEQKLSELPKILRNVCELKENTLFHCYTAHYKQKYTTYSKKCHDDSKIRGCTLEKLHGTVPCSIF